MIPMSMHVPCLAACRMFTFPEKGVDPMQAYKQFGSGKDDAVQEVRRMTWHKRPEGCHGT